LQLSASTPTQSALGYSSEKVAPTAKVLFDFTASSPFEVSVTEGSTVRVVEEDDGSGWAKVDNGQGGKGLVPATYIQLDSGGTSQKPASPISNQPSPGGSGKYGNATRFLILIFSDSLW
jgi:formin-binding protein 1